MAIMTQEKHVKSRVKQLLEKHKWYWWMPPANGFGKGGIADFNALRDGVFLAIETKVGKNKPTALQKSYLNEIMIHSGLAFVVNDQNIHWLEGWLAAFDRARDAQMKKEAVDPADGAYMLNAIQTMTEDYVV